MAVDPASTGASLLLPAIIILPVAAMLLAFLLGERRTVLTALAVTPIGAALAAAIAYVVWRDDRALVYVIGGWSPPLGVALRADGFSAAMLVTAALIISVTGLFAVGLFGVNKGERECRTSFAFWTLLLAL